MKGLTNILVSPFTASGVRGKMFRDPIVRFYLSTLLDDAEGSSHFAVMVRAC